MGDLEAARVFMSNEYYLVKDTAQDGKGDYDQHEMGDFDKDGKVDIYCKWTIKAGVLCEALNQKYSKRLPQWSNGPLNATADQKAAAQKKYEAGKLIAMKWYGEFKKALTEGRVRTGSGLKPVLFYTNPEGKKIGVSVSKEDPEGVTYDGIERTFPHVTAVKLSNSDNKSSTNFVDSSFFSDPVLLAPILKNLDALYAQQEAARKRE
ncbi:MAG: hypothetical protein HY073_01655 [Deltaproteobacteria bacterium]|nr:hypothetical protein [Deltaproteobacteria bacterium]